MEKIELKPRSGLVWLTLVPFAWVSQLLVVRTIDKSPGMPIILGWLALGAALVLLIRRVRQARETRWNAEQFTIPGCDRVFWCDVVLAVPGRCFVWCMAAGKFYRIDLLGLQAPDEISAEIKRYLPDASVYAGTGMAAAVFYLPTIISIVLIIFDMPFHYALLHLLSISGKIAVLTFFYALLTLMWGAYGLLIQAILLGIECLVYFSFDQSKMPEEFRLFTLYGFSTLRRLALASGVVSTVYMSVAMLGRFSERGIVKGNNASISQTKR